MIKKITTKDLQQAIDLITEVFREFIAADYSEQGRNTFESFLESKFEEVSTGLESGHRKMWGHYKAGEIIGVIGIRDASHISVLFVDEQHHRQGIARQMFGVVLDEIKRNARLTQVTVNSSPYAVQAYERLGFVKADEWQEKNGIVYLPMVYAVSGTGKII